MGKKARAKYAAAITRTERELGRGPGKAPKLSKADRMAMKASVARSGSVMLTPIERADAVKYSPDQPRDERGRWGQAVGEAVSNTGRDRPSSRAMRLAYGDAIGGALHGLMVGHGDPTDHTVAIRQALADEGRLEGSRTQMQTRYGERVGGVIHDIANEPKTMGEIHAARYGAGDAANFTDASAHDREFGIEQSGGQWHMRDVDIAHDGNEAAAVQGIKDQYGLTADRTSAHGPGGGWPTYDFHGTEDGIKSFAEDYHDEQFPRYGNPNWHPQ